MAVGLVIIVSSFRKASYSSKDVQILTVVVSSAVSLFSSSELVKIKMYFAIWHAKLTFGVPKMVI